MQTKNQLASICKVIRAFPMTSQLDFSGLLRRLFLGLSIGISIVGIPTSTVLADRATVQAQTPPPCTGPVPDMLYATSHLDITSERANKIWIINPETREVLCSSTMTDGNNGVDWINDIAFNQNDPVPFSDNSLYGVKEASLVRIHPANWWFYIIGQTSFGTRNSLSIGFDGFAYSAQDNSIDGSRFIQINRETGEVTPKNYLYRDANNMIISTGDMAFRENGDLFAAVEVMSSDTSVKWQLSKIDKNTGSAILPLIGNIGYPRVYGLSFRHNVLYGITEDRTLLSINPVTGVGTPIMTVSNDTADLFTGLATHVKPGDANGDGKVDGIDYVVWRNHYNTPTSKGRSEGDFNGNGFVDGIDYVVWLNNYGK